MHDELLKCAQTKMSCSHRKSRAVLDSVTQNGPRFDMIRGVTDKL